MWDGATAGCGAWVRTDGEPAGRAEVECSSGPRCQDRAPNADPAPDVSARHPQPDAVKSRDLETTRRHHYTVQTPHCNTPASLSGGAAATLVDFLTTLPLCHISDPAWAYLGVSRTLSMTFLRLAPAGQTLRIECEVLGVGRKLATVRATVKSEEDGAVLVVAEHGLVSGVMAKA